MPPAPLRLSELLPNWAPVNGGPGPTSPVRGKCRAATEGVGVGGDLEHRNGAPRSRPPGAFLVPFWASKKELAPLGETLQHGSGPSPHPTLFLPLYIKGELPEVAFSHTSKTRHFLTKLPLHDTMRKGTLFGTNGAVSLQPPKGGVYMRITLHIGQFTVTIIVKRRNRHPAR